MTTHSSILAWRIPWTEEPGGLLSIGWQRVRHDWSDLGHMYNGTGRRGKSGSSDRSFLGVQNHCGWWLQFEIKRCLLFGKKVMKKLDSILNSRDITLPSKIYIDKAMVFPVVMYGCESWAIKKVEHQRLVLWDSGVGEDSWEFLGLQGDPTSPS